MDIIELLQSGDHRAIWKASWEIIRMADEEKRAALLESLDFIRHIVSELPARVQPALRDYRFAPRLALKLLECYARQQCRCTLYPTTHTLHVRDEEKWGFIQITKQETDRERMCQVFECVCLTCGTRFEVEEEQGYHYPISTWKPDLKSLRS